MAPSTTSSTIMQKLLKHSTLHRKKLHRKLWPNYFKCRKWQNSFPELNFWLKIRTLQTLKVFRQKASLKPRWFWSFFPSRCHHWCVKLTLYHHLFEVEVYMHVGTFTYVCPFNLNPNLDCFKFSFFHFRKNLGFGQTSYYLGLKRWKIWKF